ncbi:MAG: DUF177 domain-containing protein [Eubacterium sp.]|nr:DUF177 domain-containing protein [Eubacterium sp.]
MLIDFTNLFNSDNEIINIDTVINLDDFEYSTYKPLKNGVKVKGRAYSKADVVYLELNISFDFFGICDRCADEFKKNYSFDIEKLVVSHLENEEDDENYIIVENNELNLDDYLYQEIQLFLPHKMLCNDDCKGLCTKCGANLNYEKCDCKQDVDPRMEALLQLLDD